MPGSRRALVAVLVVLPACRLHDESGEVRPMTTSGHAGSAAAAATAPAPATTRVLYPSAPGSFVDLIAKARHGVVAIRAASAVKSGPAAMFPGAPESTADVALGTGFLVDASDKSDPAKSQAGMFVVTTYHIAAASSELKVVLPDRSEVAAKLRGTDAPRDLALLQIDAPHVQPLPLGDSIDLQVGEWLVALGNPFGDDVTASAGIVSGTAREGAGSLVGGRATGFRTYLQTDAHIHRGNSGGPVLDTAGQIIGMAVATGDRLGEISFVIPIEMIRDAIPSLREGAAVQRSWLGARVLPVSADQAEAVGLGKPTGALVTEVVASSPAIRAGLRAGDVVLKWNGQAVDHRTLPGVVERTPPGKTVQVVLWRNKAEFPITIVTEKMPQ